VPNKTLEARRLTTGGVAILVAMAAVLGFTLTALSPSVAGAAGDHAAAKAARAAVATAKAAAATAKAAANSSGTADAAKAGSPSQFEVCNVAGSSNLDGVSFPYVEGTWSGSFYTTYALAAEPSPGTCGPKHSMSAGSVILVEQASSPGVPVAGYSPTFAVSNGTLSGVVAGIDFAMVTVGSGLTTLTVTNLPTPPAQTGTLELCKYGSDQYVQGSFNFNITAPGFNSSQTVPTGQCNDVTVPATDLTITEPVVFPYALASVAAIPSNALLSSNLDTQSAVVSVTPNGTSTVTFTNSTLTAYAKVCKTLDRSQDNVLAGQTFTYTPTATFDGGSISGLPTSVSVTATPFGTTTCSFLANRKGAPIALPLGTLVTFTENLNPYPFVQSVNTTVSPANLNAGSGGTLASLYVGNQPPPNNVGNLGAGSVTQATFTNEAFGNVEICKTSKSIQTGEPFDFSINGAGVAPVEVGFCSTAYTLPVGTVTVSEAPQAHITLTGVTSSAGSSWSGNSATVTVPYAADNAVAFNNEIDKGQFKICVAQSSPDAALGNTPFNFAYSYSVNGGEPVTGTFTGEPDPSPCSLPIPNVPVLNQNLTPVIISVTEETTPVADVELSGFGVVPPTALYSSPTLPHLLSSPGGGSAATGEITSLEGTTTVTFTNARTAT
jgi:hypothetical protein